MVFTIAIKEIEDYSANHKWENSCRRNLYLPK